MGAHLLVSTAAALRGRRLRQLPDERGPGPDQGHVPRELPAPDAGESGVGPRQPLQPEPEHRAEAVACVVRTEFGAREVTSIRPMEGEDIIRGLCRCEAPD